VVGSTTPLRPAQPEWLAAALGGVDQALASLSFDVPLEQRGRWRALRERLAAEVAGHRTRLADLDAPLLVVVGGVTGAGKSTLVNSLVGERVADTGPIRPTTTAPTLVAAPEDAVAVARRVAGLRTVSTHRLPAGVALVDAPDMDSVNAANRDRA
jgi:ribosome biogenesis GTPase A